MTRKAPAAVNGFPAAAHAAAETPPGVPDGLDFLEEFSLEGSRHYVYRFLGTQSTAKKELAGRIDDAERPDVHDVGLLFGEGLYVILSKFPKAGGGYDTKTSNVFRVGSDYGPRRTPSAPPDAAAQAAASAAAPAAALPAAAASISVADMLDRQEAMFKRMFDALAELKSGGGERESLSMKGVRELIETQALVMKANRDLMLSQLPGQIIGLFTGGGKGANDAAGGLDFGAILKGLIKTGGENETT